jgi:glucose/arabinose dehydrogenase
LFTKVRTPSPLPLPPADNLHPFSRLTLPHHHGRYDVHARPTLLALATLAVAACSSGDRAPSDTAGTATTSRDTAAAAPACTGDNGGLTLPAGFCATIFADSIGHARHIAVARNGDVYVNTWSGSYYSEGSGRKDGYVVALRDTTRDGKADVVKGFGGSAKWNSGGTGVALHDGWLYAEAGTRIVRYKMADNQLVPVGDAEVVVDGFPSDGDHPQHNFVIATDGSLYANMGSKTNACQLRNRTKGSPGVDPCTETETRAGIWRFDANKTGQKFGKEGRYATGIRNAVGLVIAPDGALWATQHGRDQLAENWPEKFTAQQGQENPAEVLMRVTQNADFGWPYCWFDGAQNKYMLAPEYGGDGKEAGRCANVPMPAAVFPAHWAPNDVALYTGTQFPEKYRGGAFIAFHGSWNRAPGPQGGYMLAYQALDGTQGKGKFEEFATGFGGPSPSPTASPYRPSGVAVAPDGALYVSDDKSGRIWRITYGSAR